MKNKFHIWEHEPSDHCPAADEWPKNASNGVGACCERANEPLFFQPNSLDQSPSLNEKEREGESARSISNLFIPILKVRSAEQWIDRDRRQIRCECDVGKWKHDRSETWPNVKPRQRYRCAGCVHEAFESQAKCPNVTKKRETCGTKKKFIMFDFG